MNKTQELKQQLRRSRNLTLTSEAQKEEIRNKTLNALQDILIIMSEGKGSTEEQASWCAEVHLAIAFLITCGDLKLVEYENERNMSEVPAEHPEG